MKKQKIRTMVISVGGKGERIKPYFETVNFKKSKNFFQFCGQTTVGYLINLALEMNFERIFLLASDNTLEIEDFVKQNYPQSKEISIIEEGIEGKNQGVSYALNLLEPALKENFIYSDGNIVFDKKLLEALVSIKVNNIALIAASSKDLAKTHLEIDKIDDKLVKIKVRLKKSDNNRLVKRTNGKIKKLFSMGIMVLAPEIFRVVPNFKKTYDLELALEYLFELGLKEKKELIATHDFNGDWGCLHDAQDIIILTNFFESL